MIFVSTIILLGEKQDMTQDVTDLWRGSLESGLRMSVRNPGYMSRANGA